MKTTDAFTRGQDLIITILEKMREITKWHKDFISKIILLCIGMEAYVILL